MFKVISMHSKLCKLAKYNEILRNALIIIFQFVGAFSMFVQKNIYLPQSS